MINIHLPYHSPGKFPHGAPLGKTAYIFMSVCVFICAVLAARAPTVQLSLIASVLTLKIHRSIWLLQSTESGSASRSCSVFGSCLSGDAVLHYRKLRRRVSSYSAIKFNTENFCLLEKECKMFPFTE